MNIGLGSRTLSEKLVVFNGTDEVGPVTSSD